MNKQYINKKQFVLWFTIGGTMGMNTIKDITNFIFVGKNMDELSQYDLLIINADWQKKNQQKI